MLLQEIPEVFFRSRREGLEPGYSSFNIMDSFHREDAMLLQELPDIFFHSRRDGLEPEQVQESDISSTFMCSICQNFPRLPIVLYCTHTFCDHCIRLALTSELYRHSNNFRCPFRCGTMFESIPTRIMDDSNLHTKMLFEQVKIKCAKCNSGFNFNPYQFVYHENFQCPKRTIQCPGRSCQSQMPAEQFTQHLETCQDVRRDREQTSFMFRTRKRRGKELKVLHNSRMKRSMFLGRSSEYYSWKISPSESRPLETMEEAEVRQKRRPVSENGYGRCYLCQTYTDLVTGDVICEQCYNIVLENPPSTPIPSSSSSSSGTLWNKYCHGCGMIRQHIHNSFCYDCRRYRSYDNLSNNGFCIRCGQRSASEICVQCIRRPTELVFPELPPIEESNIIRHVLHVVNEAARMEFPHDSDSGYSSPEESLEDLLAQVV